MALELKVSCLPEFPMYTSTSASTADSCERHWSADRTSYALEELSFSLSYSPENFSSEVSNKGITHLQIKKSKKVLNYM